MKKYGILNRNLNTAISLMGHGDVMIIADAGLPIPNQNCFLVDLAIAQDYPDLISIFKLIDASFVYEKCMVAEEQAQYNPNFHKQVQKVSDHVNVDLIPHEQILQTYLPKAKVIVRTGSFMPWGNIVLVSGIDTEKWFEKIDGKIPDRYFELNKLNKNS